MKKLPIKVLGRTVTSVVVQIGDDTVCSCTKVGVDKWRVRKVQLHHGNKIMYVKRLREIR